jgi:DNA-binding FadR family transcriptional regulator
MEARRGLELVLASLAAERADADAITKIHALVDAQGQSDPADPRHLQLAAAFHRAIAEAAGNPILSLYSESLAELVRERVLRQITTFDQGLCLYESHKAIADAIGNHDAAKAAQLIYDHYPDFATKLVERRDPGFLDSIIDWV